MRRLLFALALMFVTPAHAQDQANVVASCGSVTLTAGTSSFRTIDLTGQTCNSGGGGSAVVSSVWSATDAAANGWTLSNGGLTVTNPNAVWASVRGTTAHSSGKLYVEFANGPTSTESLILLGMADAGFGIGGYLSSSPVSMGAYFNGASSLGSAGITFHYDLPSAGANANDVWAIAVDLTAGKFWTAQNNVWYGSGNPATGANPMATISSPALGASFFPAISLNSISAPNSTGVWTLQPTAASQKYAPPAGFVAWDSGGATGCSQATAYLARATGETAHAADLTTLICGLVSDGVWAKLDALYILAQQTQADARLNLVGTSYGLGAGATFTAYKGLSAFPSGGVSTGFIPASAPSAKLTLNNGSAGAWVYDAPSAGVQLGTTLTTSALTVLANYGGVFYCAVNSGDGSSFVATPVSVIGLYVCDRSSGAGIDMYWDGASQRPTTSEGVGGLDTGDVRIGDLAGDGWTVSTTISEAHIGASLGSAGQLALYNRLRTYMTAVGVP